MASPIIMKKQTTKRTSCNFQRCASAGLVCAEEYSIAMPVSAIAAISRIKPQGSRISLFSGP